MDYLYKHWAYMCLPIAIYVGLLLVSSINQIPWIIFLIWLQFPVYLLHEFEEHAYPGGFKDFVNHYVFHMTHQDIPLNQANIFWINIPAIWILFPLCAVLAQHYDLKIGAVLPIFGMFNATLHIIAAIVKKMYNPGLLASVFLNYPSGIYTIYVMHQLDQFHLSNFTYSFLIALVVHAMIIVYAVSRYRRLVKVG